MQELKQTELDKIKEFLSQHRSVFAIEPSGPATTHIYRHEIDTGDAKPVYNRARRTSPAEQAIIDEHMKSMIENGIIEPSSSPWCSCVVLAAKKDGTKRFCVDYRELNARTKVDTYPLPRIEDALDIIGKRPDPISRGSGPKEAAEQVNGRK